MKVWFIIVLLNRPDEVAKRVKVPPRICKELQISLATPRQTLKRDKSSFVLRHSSTVAFRVRRSIHAATGYRKRELASVSAI